MLSFYLWVGLRLLDHVTDQSWIRLLESLLLGNLLSWIEFEAVMVLPEITVIKLVMHLVDKVITKKT